MRSAIALCHTIRFAGKDIFWLETVLRRGPCARREPELMSELLHSLPELGSVEQPSARCRKPRARWSLAIGFLPRLRRERALAFDSADECYREPSCRRSHFPKLRRRCHDWPSPLYVETGRRESLWAWSATRRKPKLELRHCRKDCPRTNPVDCNHRGSPPSFS